MVFVIPGPFMIQSPSRGYVKNQPNNITSDHPRNNVIKQSTNGDIKLTVAHANALAMYLFNKQSFVLCSTVLLLNYAHLYMQVCTVNKVYIEL